MRLSSKRWTFSLGTIVVIVLASVWFASINVGANANRSSSTNHSQPSFPSEKPASWVTQPSTLAGKVIHYFMVESFYEKGDRGMKDGRKLRGDIWEQIDSSGQVIVFRGTYTSLDGKVFYQEIFENTATNIVVFGKSTPDSPLAIPGVSSSNCILQSNMQSSSLGSSLLPMFVDENGLKGDGFQMGTGTLTQIIPKTPSFARVSPQITYSSGGSVQIWTKTETFSGGVIQLQKEEVGEQNRVLVAGSELLDASGRLMSSGWFSFGSLYVYNPGDIPSSVFSTSQQILAGGCSR